MPIDDTARPLSVHAFVDVESARHGPTFEPARGRASPVRAERRARPARPARPSVPAPRGGDPRTRAEAPDDDPGPRSERDDGLHGIRSRERDLPLAAVGEATGLPMPRIALHAVFDGAAL